MTHASFRAIQTWSASEVPYKPEVQAKEELVKGKRQVETSIAHTSGS